MKELYISCINNCYIGRKKINDKYSRVFLLTKRKIIKLYSYGYDIIYCNITRSQIDVIENILNNINVKKRLRQK